MNEKKDSVDKLLHLINDMSLLGVPSACLLIDYEFLKLFFLVDPDMKIRTKLLY